MDVRGEEGNDFDRWEGRVKWKIINGETREGKAE